MNGVKTRVEKLCQAFENGKELVELSQSSPHDISNVLKLYLRQVRLTSAVITTISKSQTHDFYFWYEHRRSAGAHDNKDLFTTFELSKG